MKKKIFFAVVVAAAAFLFWRYFLTSEAPSGQGPLVTLNGSADITQVKTLFNAHKDKKRVIVLLSPT